jgi:hypothetical protein
LTPQWLSSRHALDTSWHRHPDYLKSSLAEQPSDERNSGDYLFRPGSQNQLALGLQSAHEAFSAQIGPQEDASTILTIRCRLSMQTEIGFGTQITSPFLILFLH